MVPTVKFNNNQEFPVIGLGSFIKLDTISAQEHAEFQQIVKDGIDIGYRNIDTAFVYNTERDVGAAIRAKIGEGVIKREDVFITTKLWNTHHRPDVVVDACRRSLANLGLDYVDLYLIHMPFGFKEGDETYPKDENGETLISDVDYVDTWKAMEECVKQGLTKSIGVSNFNSKQIERVLDIATIKPVVNQVECHPYHNQNKLLKFCKERGITITAFSPLAGPTSITPLHKGEAPQPLQDPKIKELADKYDKTVAQIILRYLIQHGVVPIPKSSNKKELQENFDIFNFELSPGDMVFMDSLNRDKRICDLIEMKNHPHYPFNIDY